MLSPYLQVMLETSNFGLQFGCQATVQKDSGGEKTKISLTCPFRQGSYSAFCQFGSLRLTVALLLKIVFLSHGTHQTRVQTNCPSMMCCEARYRISCLFEFLQYGLVRGIR